MNSRDNRSHPGRGIGKKLLSEVISRAKKELKPKNIYLEVYTPNYRKLGFKTVAKFKS